MADGEPFFCVSRLGIYAARCKKGLSPECDRPVIWNSAVFLLGNRPVIQKSSVFLPRNRLVTLNYAVFLLSNAPKSGIWACFFRATRCNRELRGVSLPAFLPLMEEKQQKKIKASPRPGKLAGYQPIFQPTGTRQTSLPR